MKKHAAHTVIFFVRGVTRAIWVPASWRDDIPDITGELVKRTQLY